MHPLSRNELNRYICLGLTLQRNVNATYTIEYVISIKNVQNATNNTHRLAEVFMSFRNKIDNKKKTKVSHPIRETHQLR